MADHDHRNTGSSRAPPTAGPGRRGSPRRRGSPPSIRGSPAAPWSACSGSPINAPARRACEADLARALDTLLDAGQWPDLASLRQHVDPTDATVPAVTVILPTADAYDTLLTGAGQR